MSKQRRWREASAGGLVALIGVAIIGAAIACGAGQKAETAGKHVLDAGEHVVFVTDKAICDFLPQGQR